MQGSLPVALEPTTIGACSQPGLAPPAACRGPDQKECLSSLARGLTEQ